VKATGVNFGKWRRLVVGLWIGSVLAFPCWSLAQQPAPDAEPPYVTIRDGHFYAGNERIRFWGYNLQSGVFPSYLSMRHLVARLASLGVNGVRIWPTAETFYSEASVRSMRFPEVTRGDGSALDRYDFLFAQLKQRGIYIQNAALHYIDIATIKRWPDQEIEAALGANPSDATVRKLHGIAPYLLEGWERMLTQHIRNYLSHRNPYTGRQYADEPAVAAWELANESQFIQCLISRVCIDELPLVVQDRLRALWTAFQTKEGVPPLVSLPVRDADWDRSTTNPYHSLYRRFLFERFVEVSRRLEATARSMAAVGKGIRLQAICYSTQSGAPSLLTRAAYGAGDYSAIGSYGTRMTESEADPYYPFALYLEQKPTFYNFNFGAIKDKPTVVYETNFFRPNPYRAEWAWALLHVALTQDWDSAFVYSYGQPAAIYEERSGVPVYGTRPLPEPGGAGPKARDIYSGLHHGGDEIAVGSWAAAGGAFLAGNEANRPAQARDMFAAREMTIFPFDGARAFGPAPGYCAKGPCSRSDDSLVPQMNQMSVERPIRLDLAAITAGRNAGAREMVPVTAMMPGMAGDVASRLDTSKVRAIVDSATMAAIAGELEGEIAFSSGIRLRFPERGFGYVAIRSLDRLPLKESRSVLVMAGGQSSNTGFVLDKRKAAKGGTIGASAGVVSPGTAPVIFQRPSFEVRIAGWKGQFTKEDFNFDPYAEGAVDGVFTVSPREAFFRARLTR